MDLNYYQVEAAKTAIYPCDPPILGLYYCTIGLAGEIGEVAEKVGYFQEQTVKLGEYTPLAVELDLLKAELGDVLWYTAMLGRELGEHLDDLDDPVLWEELPLAGDTVGAMLQLVASQGRVSERVKKVLRDRVGVIGPVELAWLRSDLASVLCHLDNLANVFGLTLHEVAEANLAKLASRAKRGMLSGNGDTR
jgi:NTP pyrophosphatase (non-canonical NTP hydrolase)